MGKIAVLGTGPSLSLFDPSEFDYSIGVNDIWKYFRSDYIVCLDYPQRFTDDRLKTINESWPKKFYTQIEDWSYRTDYFPIKLQHGYPRYECLLDLEELPKSLCSPFVAVVIAYKFHHATEIQLFGVDMNDHPHLKNDMLNKIKLHFTNLFAVLRQRGIIVKVNGDGILNML